MTANASVPAEVVSIVASKKRVKTRSLTENAQNERNLSYQTYRLSKNRGHMVYIKVGE